jgi:hypothetical protein
MIVFITYLLGFGLALTACYFTGLNYFKYILKTDSISDQPYIATGEKLLAGVTSLIATIKTNGITTQSVILLILFIPIFISYNQTTTRDNKIIVSKKLILWSAAFCIFLFHWFGFYHLHDHVFYAKLGKAIYDNGNESWSALYNNFKEAKGIMIYHYSDMWLGEFI